MKRLKTKKVFAATFIPHLDAFIIEHKALLFIITISKVFHVSGKRVYIICFIGLWLVSIFCCRYVERNTFGII